MILTAEEIVAVVKKHGGDLVQMWNTEVIEGTLTVDSCMNYVLNAQAERIAKWIKERPTDGWDKWHFYNKDLADAQLKQCER